MELTPLIVLPTQICIGGLLEFFVYVSYHSKVMQRSCRLRIWLDFASAANLCDFDP
jgi:hypothetical protein